MKRIRRIRICNTAGGGILSLPYLPPVGILLVDDVENVALVEGDAQLATGNILVILGLIVYLRLITKRVNIRKIINGSGTAFICL